MALVALLVVTGCSADEPAPDGGEGALEALMEAPRVTRAAGTARIEQTIVMEFPEQAPTEGSSPGVGGGKIEVTAEGLLDLRGRRGRMSVSTEGEGLAGADALGGDMEVILDGEAMYMSSPFYSQLAPDHEPWLRVTFEELAERGMAQLGQQDPLAFVEALRGVYGDAEEVGDHEGVRGEPTVHYRSTIDIERMLAKLPAEDRAPTAAQFRQLGISEMPIEVWVDVEGRIRRLASEMTLGGESMQDGRMELLLELYDFGVAFDLARPPPGRVAEFGEVFSEVEG